MKGPVGMCDFCKIIYAPYEEYGLTKDHIVYDKESDKFNLRTYGGMFCFWQILEDIHYCPYCGSMLYNARND